MKSWDMDDRQAAELMSAKRGAMGTASRKGARKPATGSQKRRGGTARSTRSTTKTDIPIQPTLDYGINALLEAVEDLVDELRALRGKRPYGHRPMQVR